MATKAAQTGIVLHKTNLRHIYLCDIREDGFQREIALVKQTKDGSIFYIEVEPLHGIDKQRLKRVVTSPHADKYELWELMAQSKLSNGMNALDFFHTNFVKQKRAKGARAGISSLADVQATPDSAIPGSGNSNPAETNLDKGTKVFR